MSGFDHKLIPTGPGQSDAYKAMLRDYEAGRSTERKVGEAANACSTITLKQTRSSMDRSTTAGRVAVTDGL